MESSRVYILAMGMLVLGMCLTMPLKGATFTVSINHWTRDTDDGFLYPTNSSDDVSLNNNSLLWGNLSTMAGDNVTWDAVDMEFDVSADGTSKWNDNGVDTLFPKTNGRNVQLNGTLYLDDLLRWYNGTNVDVGVNLDIYEYGSYDFPVLSPRRKFMDVADQSSALYINSELILKELGSGNDPKLTIESLDGLSKVGMTYNDGESAFEIIGDGKPLQIMANEAVYINQASCGGTSNFTVVADCDGVPNALLQVQAVNNVNRVGILTYTPDQVLDVNGSANFTGDVNISDDLTIGGTSFFKDDVNFSSGGTEYMSWDESESSLIIKGDTAQVTHADVKIIGDTSGPQRRALDIKGGLRLNRDGSDFVSTSYSMSIQNNIASSSYMQILSSVVGDEGFFFGQNDASFSTGNPAGELWSTEGELEFWACNQNDAGNYANIMTLSKDRVNITGGNVNANSSNVYASALFGDAGNLTNITNFWNRSNNILFPFFNFDTVQLNNTLNMAGNNITNVNLSDASSDTILWNGTSMSFEANTSVSYCSITTDATSAPTTETRNVFDEDNYVGYSYTENARSLDTWYNVSDGNITVNNSGTYNIIFTGNIMISSSDEMNIIIKINNVPVYSHDFYVHSSVDPVGRTVAIAKILNASDKVGVWVGTVDGGDQTTFYDGCSLTVTEVGGGFSGASPNINYEVQIPSFSFQQDDSKLTVSQYLQLNLQFDGSNVLGWKAPFDGVLTYLSGIHEVSAVATWDIHVRKNGVATALFVRLASIGAQTQSGSDTDSIAFSAGDIINLYATEVAGVADYHATFSFGGYFT